MILKASMTDTSVSSIRGLILTTLLLSATSIFCLEYKEKEAEIEPLLCTVEQSGQLLDNYDILQIAKDMASYRIYETANFSINRTVLYSEDVFEFVRNGCNLLNPDCAAVITIASCPIVLVIDDWTQELSLPHLVYCTDPHTCRVTSSNSIHLAPVGPIKSDVVDILVKRILKWKELVFIYDDYLDLLHLSQLQHVLSNALVSFGVYKIHSTDQIIDDVINATKEKRHVFLAVNSNVMNVIMEKANMSGLFTKNYQWIVMSNTTCLNALNKPVLQKSNVLFLKQTPFIPSLNDRTRELPWRDRNYTEEQADLLSAGIEAIIRGTIAGDLYSKISQSNSVCDKRLITLRKKVINEAKKLRITADGGDVAFDTRSGKVESYGFEFCSTDDTSSDGYSVVGSWCPERGLHSQQSLFRNAFKDFGGKKLFIGSVQASPFVMKKQTGNVTTYEGFCIDLLQELANKLNFTYEIVEPPDIMWGVPDDNNTWNGVMGMILRGEVEFAVGPLTITSMREEVIDFTIPYLEDGVGILTKRTKLDPNAMFRLFAPLQPVVWICLGASVVGVSLLLYFVNRQRPRLSTSRQDTMTLFTCFWAILGSTLNQGSEIQPKTGSGRLVLGAWGVFTIIFVSTYTANMAAVLTITIYDKPINSLTELASQSEMKPLVKSGSNMYTLFKVGTNEIYRDIWGKMNNMPMIMTNEDALALIKSNNFAYMTDRTQLEYILLNDCETYALADEIFNTGGMGIGVPENAPYLTAFDRIIMKLQESGIIDGWRRQWWSSQGNTCNSNDRISTVDQLDLHYLAGTFFIFLGALAVSIILVVAETVYNRRVYPRN